MESFHLLTASPPPHYHHHHLHHHYRPPALPYPTPRQPRVRAPSSEPGTNGPTTKSVLDFPPDRVFYLCTISHLLPIFSASVHVSIQLHIYPTYICTLGMYVCMYVGMYVCMYVCMSLHTTYTYTYTYTYTLN
ncbi:hypothetical protein F4813DRAFT_177514 [Daldinia decipiens]|uniref:uncharacterized protein n=1 Tax=Daldinia decipiens TaxID=326647 RepID=UPI0020C1BB8D|nr:uncharacterized protein F4813DRAFT_177514 [Daldinia decipiens]KAI1661940.1 hypothetical protein F4813DRAFT_177514 [Daldinia decipiens]